MMESEKTRLIEAFRATGERPASRTPQECRAYWTSNPLWELMNPGYKAMLEAVWKEWEEQRG
jgi:hypothetical protein